MKHPLLQTYGPLDGWMILLLMGGLSIGFFVYQVQKATRLVMIGAPDSRFDSWGPRVREFVVGWLGQKKVLRDRVAGTMHSDVLGLPDASIGYVGSGYSQFILWKVAA